MIIVLESFDGGGKTTLGNYLVNYFNLPIHHSGGPQSTSLYNKTIKKINDSNQNIILDRVPWISELIYGKIFDREPMNLLEPDFKFKYIYCRPSYPTINVTPKKHKSSSLMNSIVNNKDLIQKAYDDHFFIHRKTGFITYNWQMDNLENVINFLEKR
jgi:hypothetical protein